MESGEKRGSIEGDLFLFIKSPYVPLVSFLCIHVMQTKKIKLNYLILLRVKLFQLCCSMWKLGKSLFKSPPFLSHLMSASPRSSIEEHTLMDFSGGDLLTQPLAYKWIAGTLLLLQYWFYGCGSHP